MTCTKCHAFFAPSFLKYLQLLKMYFYLNLISVMQWGQFLDHDITSTPQTRGFNNTFLKCCAPDGRILDNDLLHPDCMPIEISTRDMFYSQFNATCMEFVRSSPAPRRDCTLGRSKSRCHWYWFFCEIFGFLLGSFVRRRVIFICFLGPFFSSS